MLLDNAMAELPLLVFSVLVPIAVTACGFAGILRGNVAGASEEVAKKADVMLTIPVVVMIIGLIAAFLHLGAPAHVFNMIGGVGSSPLSNEIVVAGVAIVVAIVYWIFALAKHPAAGMHRIFGIVLAILGIVLALFTGLAYQIATVPVWNSPAGTIMQIGIALAGGATLGALVLAAAGCEIASGTARAAGVIAVVGGVIAVVGLAMLNGAASGVTSSTGATLAAELGEFLPFAAGAGILAVGGGLVQAVNKSNGAGMAAIAFVAVLVGAFLARVCFYGLFLNIGL